MSLYIYIYIYPSYNFYGNFILILIEKNIPTSDIETPEEKEGILLL